MSFEGYYQLLCKKGHYYTIDAYMFEDYGETHPEKEWRCPTCKEELHWHNLVNTTNGSFDRDEENKNIRIDGYVDLEIEIEEVKCHCPNCKVEHIAQAAIYKTPIDEGVIHRNN